MSDAFWASMFGFGSVLVTQIVVLLTLQRAERTAKVAHERLEKVMQEHAIDQPRNGGRN